MGNSLHPFTVSKQKALELNFYGFSLLSLG